VIGTPHLGAQTDGATSNMGWMVMNDCLAVLKGQEPAIRSSNYMIIFEPTGDEMNKQETLQTVKQQGVLAVIRGPSPELTIQMVGALVAAGVIGIEITYSTPNAEEVVRALAKRYGNQILLGMGTLVEPAQAESAKAAGAQFLVSPVCDPALVQAMAATGLLTMAGALTPTEVLQAYRLGSDVVKIFPWITHRSAIHQSIERTLPIYSSHANRRCQCRERR
jgi:Entner-Doudoroff aldolase